MIELTERAADQVHCLLQERAQAALGLRVFVHAGGCAGLQYGMSFETEAREGDILVESHGVRLYVDPFSATYLRGACITCADDPEESGFRVDNPNATSTCACGLSFRVEPIPAAGT